MKYFKSAVDKLFTRDFGVFGATNIVYQITFLVCEIIVLSLVSPDLIGLWQTFVVINSYLLLFRLGIINAFNREYPSVFQIYGADGGKSKLMERVTSFQTVVASSVAAFVFFSLAIMSGFEGEESSSLAALTMGFFCIIDGFNNFQESRLRSAFKYGAIAKVKVIISLCLVITLVLPYLYGFEAMLVRILLLAGASFFAFRFYSSDFSAMPLFSREVWVELFIVGWRIWLWSYLKSFYQNLPKLLILFYGSVELLGLFTPAGYFLVAFTLIASAFNSYVYPKLSAFYDNENVNVGDLMLRVVIIALGVCCILAFFGGLILDRWFGVFLPAYGSSLQAVKVALWVGALEISMLSSTVWMSSRRWFMLYFTTITALVIRVSAFLIICGTNIANITDVAYALLYSNIAITVINFLLLSRYSSKKASL